MILQDLDLAQLERESVPEGGTLYVEKHGDGFVQIWRASFREGQKLPYFTLVNCLLKDTVLTEELH